MCNKCDCDHSDQCSIVGYQPYGACCSLCASWDEEHTCPYYEVVTTKVSLAKSKLFQVASKEKAQAMMVSVERFP
jgi:hypothetical protein